MSAPVKKRRQRATYCGTLAKKKTGCVNIGLSKNIHVGTPIQLGRDPDGRVVVFWTQPIRRCLVCTGVVHYHVWRAHLRPYIITQTTADGQASHRTGLRCPRLTNRELLALGKI